MFCRVPKASLWLAGLASVAIALGTAAAQAEVRYVSTAGKNTNPCTLAQPCKTLQRGISQSPAGGEVRILDSGFYGNNANIKKSLTISGNGHTVYLGNPITINKANAVVALRGLALDGQGTINSGINIDAALAVHIERCVIRNFHFDGIVASNSAVFILDSVFRDNRTRGLHFFNSVVAGTIDNSRFENNGVVTGFPGAEVSGRMTIHRSTFSGNGGAGVIVSGIGTHVGILSTVSAGNGHTGFHLGVNAAMTMESSMAHGNASDGLRVASNAIARISNSTFTGNGTGIHNGNVVETRGNNTVRDNTTDFTGNALTPIGGD